MWLGWCGLMCGWEWEKEPLRVPSTRGWGIIGESERVVGGLTSSAEAVGEWGRGQGV
jgi:hypothetical protein